MIRIFDGKTLELIDTYESKEGKIQSLCWNRKGELLIGYSSGRLEMTVDGKGTSIFAHSSGVNEIVFDDKRNRMITCGYDGKIKIWDYNNWEKRFIKAINEH